MNFIHAAILGIVEGATEFLPISSTFHLIWTARMLGIPQTDFQKTFEVFIQSGAILAVLTLYLKTIVTDWSLVKKLVFSFIPTAVVGLVLYKIIKGIFFESFVTQLVIFVSVGVLFIILEKIWSSDRLTRRLHDLTYGEAFFIGVMQAVAVFPGVSRAGAVIFSLMYLHIERKEAAKYSFLLALPTLLAASALDLFKSRHLLLAQTAYLNLLIVGFIFSFASALVVVRWFIKYLQNHKLSIFGWYRIVVGLALVFVTLGATFFM